MRDTYLTRREVCDWLKISMSTLQRNVKNGGLPRPVMLGARPYWVEREIADHLTEQRA